MATEKKPPGLDSSGGRATCWRHGKNYSKLGTGNSMMIYELLKAAYTRDAQDSSAYHSGCLRAAREAGV